MSAYIRSISAKFLSGEEFRKNEAESKGVQSIRRDLLTIRGSIS